MNASPRLPSSLRVLSLGMLWLAFTTFFSSPSNLALSALRAVAALACELRLARSRGLRAGQPSE